MITKIEQIVPGMVLETTKEIRYLYAQKALINLNTGELIEIDNTVYDELYKTAQIERANIIKIYASYLCNEVVYQQEGR